MKNVYTLLISLMVMSLHAFAQQTGCNEDRYFNTLFEEVSVTEGVQYGQNVTIGGNTLELRMDIYEPTGDTLDKRPLIVFAHGGGFVSGNREGMDYICEDFAQRGFVTATISYRLIDAIIPDSLQSLAILMAIQDMKAAVRFFREDAATANNYRIDPDFIFAGGISAGAIMASSVGFIDSLDSFPSYLIPLLDATGGLEGNSSSNTQYSSAVQGILNYSGALPEIDFMDADDPPLYSFHDEFDEVVPCTYTPAINPLYGSCDMHAVADELGLKNQFYLRSESDDHVDWYYGTALYESAQFLGEILCENSPPVRWEGIGSGLETPGFFVGDIKAVDENVIWTIQMFGDQFSRTTDGGQTWSTGVVPVSEPAYKVVGVEAVDENTAWVLTLSLPDQEAGKVYQTTDGGLTWTEQSTSFVNPFEGPQAFHFFNENDGFALAQLVNPINSFFSSHVGYITTDGGANWEKLGPDVYPAAQGERLFVNNTQFLEALGDHLWFGTSNGKLYHSADRGQSWEVKEVAPSIAIQSVAFKDPWNGIAVSGNDVFGNNIIKAFSTSDGGESWTELTVPMVPRTTGISFVNGSADEENTCGTYIIFYFYGPNSGTLSTKDGGQSWSLISQQPTYALEFIDPETGWMGGIIHGAEEGGLFQWNGESLVSEAGCITSAKEQLVSDHSLLVYPNPFVEQLTIELDNQWQGTIALSVVNTMGQVVYTASIEKHAGNEVVELNLSTLPAGTYQLLLSSGQELMVKPIVKL